MTGIAGAGLLSAGASFTAKEAPRTDWILELLGTGDTQEVMEGLPHEMFERGLFESESKRTKTVRVAGSLFYERLLPVTVPHVGVIEEVLKEPTTLVPYGGPKLCGGFHADYAMRWKRGDEVLMSALVCFGCHEVLFIRGEEKAGVFFDLSKESYEGLRSVLRTYRQERPVPGAALGAPSKPVAPKVEIPKIDLKPPAK